MECTWLDNFCGSPFWNTSLSWNTDDPDLTSCFEKTVLVWIPCIYLWIFSGVEIYYFCHSKTRRIPWNWLNITKQALVAVIWVFIIVRAALHIISRLNDNLDVRDVDVVTPIIELVTILLVTLLMEMNRRMGLRTSGIIFVYWFISTFCGAFKAYSIFHRWTDINDFQKSYFIQFSLTFAIFILNCFVDHPPSYYGYKKSKNACPEEESGFLSRILFSWFTPLAWKGYKKPLEPPDLWDLRVEDMANEVIPSFLRNWHKGQMKAGSKKNASVLPALFKSFGLSNIMASFLKITQDTLIFVSPIVLRWLIDFIENGEELWKGFLYAGILFVASSLQTLMLAQYFYRMITIGVQVRSALIAGIYRKALKISIYSRKDSTVGEIVNLMAVDAQKFADVLSYINLIWSAPYQIIVALYLLWQTLGIAVLSGLTVLILLIPVNTYIIRKVKQFQVKQMRYKDERIKVTNEVFSGIKILKLYAWEPTYADRIQSIRAKELRELRKAAFMNAAANFVWTCAPILVCLCTFATYVLIDEKNVLTAKIAFVSISLFNILKFPMGMLPNLFSMIAQVNVSLRRINRFMNLPELDPANVTHDSKEDCPLLIEKGTFSWGNQPILQDINIHLPALSLTAVIGHVGSGKSSLISALLGEMEKLEGRVNTVGSIAYVSQQAWIQNATLKDNILFGCKFDQEFYNKVIEACALKEDLLMLPGGDQTEIGEKGINLSGGQKQRVNLARAVYANRDVYLLDDPLSAVDCHVAKHLFEKVVGPNGMLKNKTRVLSTHGITFLPHVDQILVLTNGVISETGTYIDLLTAKGPEYLEKHIQACYDQKEEDERRESLIAQKLQEITRGRSDSLRDSIQLERSISCNDSFGGASLEPEVTRGQLTETEKMEVGGVSLKVYKQYILSIGPILCLLIFCLDTSLQSFGLGSNFWLSKWSNDKSASEISKRNEYLEVYGLLGLGQGISSFLMAFTFAQGFYQSSVKAHQRLLLSCLKALQSFFDTTPLGRILNRFSNDMNCLDNTLPFAVYQAVTSGFALAATLFIISYNAPPLLVIIALTGVAYFFIQRVYQATCRQLKRMESVSRSPIYSYFSETLSGTSTIRAYMEQERFITESDKRVDTNQVCYYYGLTANRWLSVRLESIANLIILCAALFAVLGRDTMSPGIVGLSVSYALQITQTLSWLVRVICDVETNIVSIERIEEYSGAPQEAPWEIEETKPSPIWPDSGVLSFEKYSVRYRPGLDLVLKNVDISIKGGEKVGIVGRTGAGKSSLTLCLFRIIEAAEGSISIDGIDISKIGLHSLRSKITIIPQDAVLFSGNLRMNLDPYNKYTDEEIWTALEHAHLKEFVAGCPNGLDYEVAEGGENFSIGQRQLICLSRALLRKTRLFILDEATAAVDLQTDDLIQKTIRTQFKECTILTIAHRLNTILDYDRVIVLDKGCIKEFDTPQKLIEMKNIFYSMCKEAKLI